jgi:hypothetical protein
MISIYCNVRDSVYTTDRWTEALYWHFTVISWHTRCGYTETEPDSVNVDQTLIQEALSDGQSRWYGVKSSWFRTDFRSTPAGTNVTNDKPRWLGIFFPECNISLSWIGLPLKAWVETVSQAFDTDINHFYKSFLPIKNFLPKGYCFYVGRSESSGNVIF